MYRSKSSLLEKIKIVIVILIVLTAFIFLMRFAEKQVQLDCQKRWENFNFEVKFIRGSGCSVKTNHGWVRSDNIHIEPLIFENKK